MAGIEPVGTYALRFVFSDGHDSGLYSWDLLYNLGRRRDTLWPGYLAQIDVQGLSRYDDDAGTQADYIVVEMAKHLLGENWAAQYVGRANNGGIERFLL